jgi:hypothetical protein
MGLGTALKILCGKWWVASGADIHNVNSGNVGIGTAAPTARLHVREAQLAVIGQLEGNGQGSLRLSDGAANRGSIGFGGPGLLFSDALPESLGVRSEGAIHLGVESSVAMTVREVGYGPGTGYVGVGTTEPTAILTVAGEDSPRVHVTSNSGANPSGPSRTWGLLAFADEKFYVTDVTGISDCLTVVPGGNVGIGTSNPTARLDVAGDCHVAGNLVVTGSKSALVETEHYGKRLLYAHECATSRLVDEGTARLDDGVATVPLDPLFSDTVEGDVLVHVTPHGRASLYVADSGRHGFVVRLIDGDPAAEFAWLVSGTRKGHAGIRLEALGS